MRYLGIVLLFLLAATNISLANEKSEIQIYRDLCRADLNFFRNSLKENSAIYANKDDKAFKEWYVKGHEDTLKLIDLVSDKDDCFYAMKYYINGFDNTHISMRGYIPLQPSNIQVY